MAAPANEAERPAAAASRLLERGKGFLDPRAALLAVICRLVDGEDFGGCAGSANAAGRSAPRSTTGNIQLVVGITFCASAETR